MKEQTIYWYDLETFGIDPRRDRVAQFAGLRTDEQLNILGDPLVMYCKPADDFLPHPDACLITGITPQIAAERGLPEAEFIAKINHEFAHPNTCVAGYNSLRFDDEFTRNLLYRNFFDPYAREWQNGNSRWDLIDTVRLTRALRPEGISWPVHDDAEQKDNATSFKLEQLTAKNNIQHVGAHDALADIYATINVAKLIRESQPKLFDYVYQHRTKRKVASLLSLAKPQPVLHVSAMYPARQGCIAIVAPLAQHPRNQSEIIVCDLRLSPDILLDLSVEELQQQIFTASSDLPAGTERLPIKTIRINKAPVVVPLSTLTSDAEQEWDLQKNTCLKHWGILDKHRSDLSSKLVEVFSGQSFLSDDDPDLAIYSGGFFADSDKGRMQQVQNCSAQQLKTLKLHFDDPRLQTMLFRYRARNYPQSLTPEETQQWREFRAARLRGESAVGALDITAFDTRIAALQSESLDAPSQAILSELVDYRNTLLEGLI